MSELALFGPIVAASDVEAAVTSTLKLWLPTYLAELERRTGRDPGVIAPPRSWRTVNRFDQKQADQLPAVIVVAPGTEGDPELAGDGLYSAWWRVGVAVIVTAKDHQAANELAKLYAAAIRTGILHHQSLGGLASRTVWVGEDSTEAPADYLPVGAVAETDFLVLVEGVVTDRGGPAEPDLDPGELTQFETVEIDVERRSVFP